MDLTTIEMRAGDMRTKVALLQPSNVADGIGDIGVPSMFGPMRWAEVRTLSGTEFFRSQQFTSEANRAVIMWFTPGVNATMTIGIGPNGDGSYQRNLTILYVDDVDEKHVKLVLFVKEVT